MKNFLGFLIETRPAVITWLTLQSHYHFLKFITVTQLITLKQCKIIPELNYVPRHDMMGGRGKRSITLDLGRMAMLHAPVDLPWVHSPWYPLDRFGGPNLSSTLWRSE
jgi:hypothetical protein